MIPLSLSPSLYLPLYLLSLSYLPFLMSNGIRRYCLTAVSFLFSSSSSPFLPPALRNRVRHHRRFAAKLRPLRGCRLSFSPSLSLSHTHIYFFSLSYTYIPFTHSTFLFSLSLMLIYSSLSHTHRNHPSFCVFVLWNLPAVSDWA